MPRLSPAIERANAILRAHGTPFRLREGHGNRWLSVYENQPGPKVREKAARGFVARDDRAVEDLTSRLLVLSQDGASGGGAGGLSTIENGCPKRAESPRRWPVDLSQQLTSQLKAMERLVDGQTGAILFRHPELRGIPDLVVEGDGYTLEFIGSRLLCLRP